MGRSASGKLTNLRIWVNPSFCQSRRGRAGTEGTPASYETPPEGVPGLLIARKLCPTYPNSKHFAEIPQFHKNLTVGTHFTNPAFIDFTR
jgi:hypothetical protein